jgi:pimeloyl-ACP methyl ester carboxylesterase
VTGTLKNWSIINELYKINVPTLLLNGRHDQATDEVTAPFFYGITKVKWVTLENSSHMPHFEERERFMEVVSKFLVHH